MNKLEELNKKTLELRKELTKAVSYSIYGRAKFRRIYSTTIAEKLSKVSKEIKELKSQTTKLSY